MKKAFYVFLAVSVMSLSLLSCGKKSTSGILKIGLVTSLSYPIGVDQKKCTELLAEMVNKKGGLTVGDKTYEVQLITYDAKMNDADSRSAVERLVYQDKVNFILGDQTVDAWVSITEQNKIVAVACTPSPAIFNPKYKYVFQGTNLNTQLPAWVGWISDNRKDIKTVVTGNSDTAFGHVFDGVFKKLFPLYGIKVIGQLNYPIDATDLSSIGTKVAALKPDGYVDYMYQSFKAVYDAGWKGQQMPAGVGGINNLKSYFSDEAMEGMIMLAFPVEDENPTGAAKEFKDAYIEKYGKWDDPGIHFVNSWYILVAALQKAGTLDSDKVAEAIGGGLEYDTMLASSGKMISRPDMGITRTVDTVFAQPMKKIEKGKVKIIDNISLEKTMQYNKKFFGWK